MRSSVAAFYALPERFFYTFAGSGRRDSFLVFRLLLRAYSEVEQIVHPISEVLFATEIAFRGLDRCMSE